MPKITLILGYNIAIALSRSTWIWRSVFTWNSPKSKSIWAFRIPLHIGTHTHTRASDKRFSFIELQSPRSFIHRQLPQSFWAHSYTHISNEFVELIIIIFSTQIRYTLKLDTMHLNEKFHLLNTDFQYYSCWYWFDWTFSLRPSQHGDLVN